jgi:hypothetical protein
MKGASPEGAPERSPKAGEGAPSGVDGNGPKRFSVQRKMAIVARLLRGPPLDLVPGKRISRSPAWPIGAIARDGDEISPAGDRHTWEVRGSQGQRSAGAAVALGRGLPPRRWCWARSMTMRALVEPALGVLDRIDDAALERESGASPWRREGLPRPRHRQSHLYPVDRTASGKNQVAAAPYRSKRMRFSRESRRAGR